MSLLSLSRFHDKRLSQTHEVCLLKQKNKYMNKAKETRRKNTCVGLINGLLAWMLTHRRCSKKLIVQIGIYIKIIKALIKIEL